MIRYTKFIWQFRRAHITFKCDIFLLFLWIRVRCTASIHNYYCIDTCEKGQMKSQTFPTFNFTDETMMIMIHFGWKKKIIIRKYGIFLILGTWESFPFTCSGFFDQKRFLGKLIYPRSSTAYSICFKYGPLALIHECETNNY